MWVMISWWIRSPLSSGVRLQILQLVWMVGREGTGKQTETAGRKTRLFDDVYLGSTSVHEGLTAITASAGMAICAAHLPSSWHTFFLTTFSDTKCACEHDVLSACAEPQETRLPVCCTEPTSHGVLFPEKQAPFPTNYIPNPSSHNLHINKCFKQKIIPHQKGD